MARNPEATLVKYCLRAYVKLSPMVEKFYANVTMLWGRCYKKRLFHVKVRKLLDLIPFKKRLFVYAGYHVTAYACRFSPKLMITWLQTLQIRTFGPPLIRSNIDFWSIRHVGFTMNSLIILRIYFEFTFFFTNSLYFSRIHLVFLRIYFEFTIYFTNSQ